MKTANGAEILIHVGIDTVSMMVTVLSKKLHKVTRLKLVMFLEHLILLNAAAGLDDTTMVIVTNTADYASVTPVATGAVAKGDAIIEIKHNLKYDCSRTG